MESMMFNPTMTTPSKMMHAGADWSSKNFPSWACPSMFDQSTMSMNPMWNPAMSNPSSMMMPPMWNPSMMMPSMNNWMMPSMSSWKNEACMRTVPCRPSNWMECTSMADPVKMDSMGNRCFMLHLDMHLYKPEEIKVCYNAAKKCCVVEACCEEKMDTKACPAVNDCSLLTCTKGCTKRTYYREFCLPEECKPENMKCHLSFDGWLTFECPMPSMCPSTMEKTSMSSVSMMSPSAYFATMSSCPSSWSCHPSMMMSKSMMSNRFDAVPVNVTMKA